MTLNVNYVIGTVITVDSVYWVQPEPRSLGFKLLVMLILIPVIFMAIVISVVSSLMGGGRGHRGGFLSDVGSQMVSYNLHSRLLLPKEKVPVRDFRLIDRSGNERLVRIRGELIRGNVNVGDEIEVHGANRGGTIMLERGWNRRTGTEILVKK